MQVQKATSDVQVKTITVQAEKMTRALHALHRENTDLQVELRVTRDRLNVAHQAVDKMVSVCLVSSIQDQDAWALDDGGLRVLPLRYSGGSSGGPPPVKKLVAKYCSEP